ncbi:hypothetical protein KDW_46560 [Dictyobacter vulcani]|uniref:Uncharacterized protein n=1 Tax=Dictyobacter vulcani TaxID=2607529 RepID=A0A5J4KM92_9CHLR|nr:hypothetical protein [Dictyobacter vulcani]GER90494.1 hypothetical protein KDW_46560 [Dictyobacter vulcani]
MWKFVLRMLKCWLPYAIIIVGLSGLLYVVGQQVLRQQANDPQIQMAEDTAARLAAGEQPQALLPADKVDVATSIAPYLVMYDANGKPVAGSGQLNGQLPTLPAGVFDSVRKDGEDRVTWQPLPGVRSATVVSPIKGGSGGFVMAGRSLRESELRTDDLGKLILVGCLGLLVLELGVVALLFRNPPRRRVIV